jgi:signal transduction histidine kinase
LKAFNLKYAFIVFLSLLFIIVVSIFFINKNQLSRINNILDQHLITLENYYKVLSYKQASLADATYKETIENKGFMQLFLEANVAKDSGDTKKLNLLRDKVKQLLDAKYNILKMRGVLQYHFVFGDNKVFLRMHKPSKFGDDLSTVRTDFATVNRTLKPIRGFAQGRTAHGFRNVYPILDHNKNHLGALEVSFSSEQIQDYLTNINQLHTHFIVRKDIFESHAWKRDDLVLKYYESAENKNFMLNMTKQHTKDKCIVENRQRIIPIKDQINKNILKEKPFALYTFFNDIARVVSFYPIKQNVTKETVAWIVSYKPNKVINDIIKGTTITKIFITIFLTIVALFVYFLLIQRSLLNKMVEEKTKHLHIVNKELEESEEELKLLNENLEYRVQEEISKNKEKDKILLEQNKMAALGEMIANIAHQWRQPLSVISTSASGMMVQNNIGVLDKGKIDEYCENINENAQYLSKTIEDFRNFIRGDSKREKFNLKETVNSFLNLVESSRKKNNIHITLDIPDELDISGLKNELNQCLINLFNNSKDILIEKNSDINHIKISAKIKANKLILYFQDNGGGIDENIMDKVFEPYFTTKHQSIGTGLGLNMVYRFITEGMGGMICVSNESFKVANKEYFGAKFIIEIPLSEI